MRRFVEEEAQRQQNMEDITVRALPQLDENAKPDSIENDWITNFFAKCRIVSGNEMQELWSRILAGEANVPGTYARRGPSISFRTSIKPTLICSPSSASFVKVDWRNDAVGGR